MTLYQQNEKLVIISLPFYRIARMSLSSFMLNALSIENDILILAPFAEEKQFVESFSQKNINFLTWEMNNPPAWKLKIIRIAELLRVNGFWRKFKTRGMAYYVHNQCNTFGPDGNDTKFSFLKRNFINLLSYIGISSNAWKLCQRLAGKSWFSFPKLVNLTKNYKQVTLIQSANWGLQDLALSRLSRIQKWRTVFLPYTTDQLYANGYLINDFDALCVKGPYEYSRAINFFEVPENRVFPLGSVWFKNLEKISKEITQNREGRIKYIMYAGMSATFFSRNSEFAAVDALIKILPNLPKNLKLVYRPVEFEENRRAEISKRYENSEIILQWPDASSLGLEKFEVIDHQKALEQYALDLLDCELMIMSAFTTLAHDVVFLAKCPVISNLSDVDGMLAKRNNNLLSKSSEVWEIDGWPGIRVAHTIESLVENIYFALNNVAECKEEATKIIKEWDFPEANFDKILLDAVYGETN